jgi:hypothetical protein
MRETTLRGLSLNEEPAPMPMVDALDLFKINLFLITDHNSMEMLIQIADVLDLLMRDF